MWLKCVLHLQVLHALRYDALEMLVALVLTPVQHLVSLIIIIITTHLQRLLLHLPAHTVSFADRPHLQGQSHTHLSGLRFVIAPV